MLSKRFVKTIIRGSRTGYPFTYGAFANKHYVYYLTYSLDKGWYKILRAKISDAKAITDKINRSHYAGYFYDWIKTDKVETVFQDLLIQSNVEFNSFYEFRYNGELLCYGSGR